jgi:hypothetical protein
MRYWLLLADGHRELLSEISIHCVVIGLKGLIEQVDLFCHPFSYEDLGLICTCTKEFLELLKRKVSWGCSIPVATAPHESVPRECSTAEKG